MPLGSLAVAIACAFVALSLATAVAPARAFAADPQEKHDEPAITHLVQENRDGIFRSIADWPQGTQFTFKATGTLPDRFGRTSAFEYWLVATPEATLRYVDGSARFAVVHADGTEEDVTAQMTVTTVGSSIVAGSADVKAATPGLMADDELVLYYTCEYDPSFNLGFGHGNPSYAHAEYTPAQPAVGTASLTTQSTQTPREQVVLAAQASDPRSQGLSSTPDIKATVYCYALDIVKLAADTGKPLAGASFVLRDDDGLYYVKGQPWASDASKATVMTSGADGSLLFPGLDHDVYELVETQAPAGYDAVGPIDIMIETKIPDEREEISITSKTVTITSADSTTGTIGFSVEDPVKGSGKPGSDNPSDKPGSDDPSSGGSDDSSGGGLDANGDRDGRVRPASQNGLIAVLGDPVALGGMALVAAAALAIALLARRRGHHERR